MAIFRQMTPTSHVPRRLVLLRNVFANWAGLAAEITVAFFLTPYIIHGLGPAVYGVWSLANGIIGYLGLIDLGIRGSLGRFVNQYLARGEHRALNELLSSAVAFLTGAAVVVGIVAVVLGEFFGLVFPKTPPDLAAQMALVLPLLAIGLWISFVSALFRSVLAAYDRFPLLNVIGLATLALRAGLVVLALHNHYGLLGLVFAVVVSSGVGLLAAMLAAHRVHRPLALGAGSFSVARLREVWRFGVVALITRSASEIVYQSDQIVLMMFLGPRAVAVHSIANMLLLYGQRIVEQLGVVIDPSVMKSGGVGDYAGLRTTYSWYPRVAYFVAIPVYVGFIVFGGQFIRLWVGPEFEEAIWVLRILSIAELATLFTSIGGNVLFSLGRLRFGLYCSCGEALLNVALTLALVGWFGMGTIGAAIGTLVAAVACRGIIHPWYTTSALGMRFGNYFRATIPRALGVILAAYLVFYFVESKLGTASWATFAGGVMLATVAYLSFGPAGMLGWRNASRIVASLAPRRHRA